MSLTNPKMENGMNKVDDCKKVTTSNSGAARDAGGIPERVRIQPWAAEQGRLRSVRLAVASLAAAVLLSTMPAMAQNLGLSVDQLIEQLGSAAEVAGQPLEFRELSCIENEKPGSSDQKIVSCTHMLGNGRLLITNSEPDGPLLDIATQPWEGGENGAGAMMIAWIAAAINDGEPDEYGPAANELAGAATSGGDGSATIGEVSFFVLDLGGDLTITAMAQ